MHAAGLQSDKMKQLAQHHRKQILRSMACHTCDGCLDLHSTAHLSTAQALSRPLVGPEITIDHVIFESELDWQSVHHDYKYMMCW